MSKLFDDIKLEDTCPYCSKVYKFTPNDLGKYIICPHCSKSIYLEDTIDAIKEMENIDNLLNSLGEDWEEFY